MANPATATAAMIPLVTISAGSRQRSVVFLLHIQWNLSVGIDANRV
jgi:hypothetical protein